MKNKLHFLLIILLFTNIVNGQSFNKGQKKIDRQDFSGAVTVFNKILNKGLTNPIAYYGLALVYSNNLNPNKDLFAAIHNINLSKKYFLKLNDYGKQKVSSVLSEIIINQKLTQIDDELFKYIIDKNDTVLIKSFLNKCSFSKHYDQATQIRDEIIFSSVLEKNTIHGYESFIKKYPDAFIIKRAIELRNQLVFTQVKDTNTIKAYNEFILKYPSASEINDAVKYRNILAFEDAFNTNTIEVFEAFIKNYPMAEQKDKVLKLRDQKAFDLALSINSIAACKKFIDKYPDSELCTQANEEIAELNKWKCIPGIIVGEIEYNTSEKDISKKYGEYNIMRDSAIINNKSYYGTFLFPNNPEKKLFIIWKNKNKFVNPDRIIIYGNKWQTNKGIKIGTTIKELITYNDKDILIKGLKRNDEGMVRSWNDGELSVLHKLNVNFFIKLSYDKDKFYNILDEGIDLLSNSESISSNNKYVKMIDFKVDYMEILFPRK